MTRHRSDRAARVGRRVAEIPRWVTFTAFVVALAALTVGGMIAANRGQDAQGDNTHLRQQAAPLAGGVQAQCSEGGAAGAQLASAGLCQQASRVQQAVESPTATPSTVAGLSSDQVRIIARAQTIAFLQQHPAPAGKNAPPVDVDAIVTRVVALVPHPRDGADGRDAPAPTAAQLYAQIAAYCTSDADPCRGQTGPAGTNGATGDTGPQGPPGQTGPGLADQHFARNADGACVSTDTYTDGRVTTQQAGDAACPPLTTPTPTPGG